MPPVILVAYKKIFITLEIPRILEDFVLPKCSWGRMLRPNNIMKDAPISSVTQEITRVLGILCQEMEPNTKYIYISPRITISQ